MGAGVDGECPGGSASSLVPSQLDIVDFGRITTVIFDFYNTLVEDDIPVVPMWRQLMDLGYQGHPALEAMFEPDAFDGCTTPRSDGRPSHEEWLHDNWARVLSLAGVPEHLVPPTRRALLERQRRWRGRASPGVVPLIGRLRTHGYAVIVCSNWEDDITPYLEYAGLPFFDHVVTSAQVGARKPHDRIFAEVLTLAGAKAHECLFVGDNWETDIVGAVRAGMRAIWLRKFRTPRGISHLVPEVDSVALLEVCIREYFNARRSDSDDR